MRACKSPLACYKLVPVTGERYCPTCTAYVIERIRWPYRNPVAYLAGEKAAGDVEWYDDHDSHFGSASDRDFSSDHDSCAEGESAESEQSLNGSLIGERGTPKWHSCMLGILPKPKSRIHW